MRQPDDLEKALPPADATADGGWEEPGDAPGFWEPKEPGEVVFGTVAAKSLDGKYGAAVKVLTADGAVVSLPSHRGLQAQLEKVWGKLTPGQTVLKVEFTGEDEETGRRNYHLKFRQGQPERK